MQDLRLVGMTEDGGAVIVVDADNQRFRLAIDDGLRSIVRRAGTPRLGGGPGSQRVPVAPGTLRPRDIQARIRGGESAEEVARLAGLPLEKVRRYEGPILAERGHIADAARRATVRRPGEGTVGTRHCVLDDEVSARLQRAGGDPEASEWDAWRQDESRWTVRVRYWLDHEEHQADFVYDALSRVSLAADQTARWLLGEEPRQQVKDDLRRFKQVMETGEVVRSDGSPEGQNARRHLKQRPARPPSEPVGAGRAS